MKEAKRRVSGTRRPWRKLVLIHAGKSKDMGRLRSYLEDWHFRALSSHFGNSIFEMIFISNLSSSSSVQCNQNMRPALMAGFLRSGIVKNFTRVMVHGHKTPSHFLFNGWHESTRNCNSYNQMQDDVKVSLRCLVLCWFVLFCLVEQCGNPNPGLWIWTRANARGISVQ